MVKACTQRTCHRTHDTRFKLCPTCRERHRKSGHKRKAAAALTKCKQVHLYRDGCLCIIVC